MNWGIFWGIFLMLIGLGLIIKVIFKIDIPLVKFFIGFVFIYLGIKLFVGRDFSLFSNNKGENMIMFEKKTVADLDNGMDYNVIFGKGVIDLTKLDSEVKEVKLNTIFGTSNVIVSDSIPFKIQSTAAFAGATMPDGNTNTFGTMIYENFDTVNNNLLFIESNTVFGRIIFKKDKK